MTAHSSLFPKWLADDEEAGRQILLAVSICGIAQVSCQQKIPCRKCLNMTLAAISALARSRTGPPLISDAALVCRSIGWYLADTPPMVDAFWDGSTDSLAPVRLTPLEEKVEGQHAVIWQLVDVE